MLNIADLTEEEVTKMDQGQVQVHNLGEENTVGCVNYELKIRGKSNLDCVSIRIVLNRSVDLYNKIDSKVFSLKKETDEIKIVKNEWNKMRALEKKVYFDPFDC